MDPRSSSRCIRPCDTRWRRANALMESAFRPRPTLASHSRSNACRPSHAQCCLNLGNALQSFTSAFLRECVCFHLGRHADIFLSPGRPPFSCSSLSHAIVQLAESAENEKRVARKRWVLVSYMHFVGRSVAQPGSAFGSGPKGRGFKSLHSDHPKVPHPWWNWQTRKIQVLMLRDVWVRVPPGAPSKELLRPHRLSARTQGSHPWKSGPTPLGGAIRRGGRAWLNAHDSKSCVPQGTGGSNPSLSATF